MVQTVGCQPCFQGKSSPPSYGARLDFFRIFDRAMRFFLLPHGRFRDIVKNMKQNSSLTKDTLDSLLSPSVTVMPEGFAINLELMEAELFYKRILDRRLVRLYLQRSDRMQSGKRRFDLEVVVSVDAGDLLNDIRFDGDILGCAPGRNLYREHLSVL